MDVCMYVCRQTCMSKHLYMHVCKHTYLNPYVYMYACMDVDRHVSVNVWMGAYGKNCMYVCTNHIYTYMHTECNISFNHKIHK